MTLIFRLASILSNIQKGKYHDRTNTDKRQLLTGSFRFRQTGSGRFLGPLVRAMQNDGTDCRANCYRIRWSIRRRQSQHRRRSRACGAVPHNERADPDGLQTRQDRIHGRRDPTPSQARINACITTPLGVSCPLS